MGSKPACLRYSFQNVIVGCALCFLIFNGLLVKPVTAQSAPWPRLLIISADLFLPALPPLVALKESQGFTVIVKSLSETGSTREQIKTAIAAQYASLAPPDYLLLVGDQDSLQAWPASTYSGYTDLYYATMDSVSDYVADMMVGRLPVHTVAQLEAVTAKWSASQGLSFDKLSLIATDDPQHSSQVEETYLEMIRTYTLPGGYQGSFPNNPQPGGDRLFAVTHGAETIDVLQALGENRALVVYSGHTVAGAWSGPAVTQEQVKAMDSGIAAMVASFAGDTASFTPSESYADSWVLLPQAGALAYIGAAGATNWTQDDAFQRVFFQALFTPMQNETTGQVLKAALGKFDDLYPFNAQVQRSYHELYQLMGDPTLQTPVRDQSNEFSVQLVPSQVEICTSGEAQVQVELQSQYTFAYPAQLNAFQLPFGVQAQWASMQSTIPGTSLLTLQAQASAPAGKYPITIEAATVTQVQNGFLTLSIFTGAPLRPALLSPAAASRDISLRPALTWSTDGQAGHFTVEIASDPDFINLVYRIEHYPQTSLIPDESLQPGERYYWRVTAENACGSSEPSYAASFVTRPLPGTCAAGDTPVALATSAAGIPFAGWSVDPAGAAWNLLPGATFAADALVYAGKATAGVINLVSTPLQLPADTRNPTLTFNSWMNFGTADQPLHGGLLELSIDEGATWQPLAETAILSTPYDGPLSSLFGNPLGGSLAWLGSSGGWKTVHVDLSGYVGETLQARFRLSASTPPPAGDWHWALSQVTAQTCSGTLEVAAQLLPTDQLKIIAPGGEQAYEFEMSNLGKPTTFNLQVEPAGWPVEINPQTLPLSAGETKNLWVTLHAPAGVAAGSLQHFNLVASSPDDANLHIVAPFQAQIQQAGVDLQPVEMALVGRPAEWLRFCVWVTNTGNVPDQYHVSAVSAAGWEVSLSRKVIQLQPGQSAELTMDVHIPLDAHPAQQDQITIQVSSTVDPTVSQNTSLTARVAGQSLYLPVIGS